MRREINDDNLYKEGTIVSAKVDPSRKLVIMRYRQRIYYCAVVDHPDQNDYAYFEKELIPPTIADNVVQYSPVPAAPLTGENFVFKRAE
ncbi:hypothetical protein WSM22_38790 [Cytophagales bacterium WSM2-2]|nr:hypothetical protein WSM22_38790 [Cytophagales bacterium WSM2-2]